jgi:hypothetical protein
VKNANKLIVVGAGVLAAGAATLTLMSTGVAGAAPDVSGQTFSEAQAALKEAGYTAVVSTAVGDAVSQGDCTVVRQNTTTASSFVGGDWTGQGSTASSKVMLSLDCSTPPKAASSSGSG